MKLRVSPNCSHQIATCGDQSHVVAECKWDDYRDHIIACVNACHRAGLTAEDLEQDAVGKLVEAAEIGLSFIPECKWGYKHAEVVAALAPFRKGGES